MDLSYAEEMTIDQILRFWFWYEPKEETLAARRKMRDEQKKILKILYDGIKNGRLQHRIKIKEIKRDVFPNSSTRKFATEQEDKLYQGLPYTRTDSIKTVYVSPLKLAQFLAVVDIKPPEDSPLMEWLVNGWKARDEAPGQTKEVFPLAPVEMQNKRERKTNLRRAIESAMQSFKGKPSFGEFWEYIQDDKDETGFIEDFTDEAVTWRDTKGKLHDSKKKSVANLYSKLKYPG